MKSLLWAVIATALLGCSSSNEPESENYSGITYTDITGKIVGPVDQDDWKPIPENCDGNCLLKVIAVPNPMIRGNNQYSYRIR